jgi:C4-dicarboxylate-specific signal transduction histidine kinase
MLAWHHGERCISADDKLLQQAWNNLIRCALEAMDSEGKLQLGHEVQGRALLLYLQNSSPGIPVEQMTRLFEPF